MLSVFQRFKDGFERPLIISCSPLEEASESGRAAVLSCFFLLSLFCSAQQISFQQTSEDQ